MTSARDYALINDNKAYLFDYETYKVHGWDPADMTLNGIEIDLGAARRPERGPLAMLPWRFDQVRRDNLLFIAGAWWPEDGPQPYSLVFVFDTDADTVTVVEDPRCVNIGGVKATDNGDVYFLCQHFGAFTNDVSPCALVIRNGQVTFDPGGFERRGGAPLHPLPHRHPVHRQAQCHRTAAHHQR